MERIEITKSFSNSGSRNDVRMRVVNEFAKELPGYGNKDKASRYIYYVETLENGDRIYLQRPANLHNGFDFLVCVENINYAEGTGKRRRNYPKHTDIETDLVNKKNENLELYRKLYDLIDDVYNCKDISSEEMSSREIYSGNLVQTGLELNPSLYAMDHWIFRIRCEVGEPTDRKTAWVLFCGVGYFSAASFNWLVLDSYDNRISWNFTGESMLDETMPSIAQMVFFK